MSVKLNSKGSINATKLVNNGKVTKSESWSAPTTDAENNYINKNGISSYGEFFLGIDSDEPSDTKGHYKYPFSNNFSTVNLAGLKAIRQRSSQNNALDIFNKVGQLIDKIEGKKKEARADDIYWIGD